MWAPDEKLHYMGSLTFIAESRKQRCLTQTKKLTAKHQILQNMKRREPA
jgi:hypothetical protein